MIDILMMLMEPEEEPEEIPVVVMKKTIQSNLNNWVLGSRKTGTKDKELAKKGAVTTQTKILGWLT